MIVAIIIGSLVSASAQTNFYATTNESELNFQIDETINPGEFNGKVYTMVSRPSHYIEVRFNNEFGSGSFQLGVGGASTCDIVHWLCDLFGWNYPSNPC